MDGDYTILVDNMICCSLNLILLIARDGTLKVNKGSARVVLCLDLSQTWYSQPSNSRSQNVARIVNL